MRGGQYELFRLSMGRRPCDAGPDTKSGLGGFIPPRPGSSKKKNNLLERIYRVNFPGGFSYGFR